MHSESALRVLSVCYRLLFLELSHWVFAHTVLVNRSKPIPTTYCSILTVFKALQLKLLHLSFSISIKCLHYFIKIAQLQYIANQSIFWSEGLCMKTGILLQKSLTHQCQSNLKSMVRILFPFHKSHPIISFSFHRNKQLEIKFSLMQIRFTITFIKYMI